MTLKRRCLDANGDCQPETYNQAARCQYHTTVREANRRPTATERYGAGFRERHAELYGRPCELRLEGCTGIADTAQHTVRVADGGRDSRLIPACKHCNSKAQ